MKKRKGLALLLSLAMIVGLLPMTAFADGGIMPDENGFLISGGMLLEYTGNAEEVVIPDTVTDIVAGFKNNAKIVKVTIPKTVKTIGQNVFSGCSALKEVVFQTDSALKNIGNNAFKSCTQLKEIKLPDSVESIGTGAFASMGYKFTTFKIPAGVTKLGTTGKDVFSGSNALSVIDVSSENQTYESYDGVIYKKADKSVYFCPPGRTGSVSIKAGTETIGENAFNNGSGKIGPDYVDIPDTVTSIANGAFENSFARCCTPMPGDPIVGFITRGSGISVHRRDCQNVEQLQREPERIVPVSWAANAHTAYRVQIDVEALDRGGLLADITRVLADNHVNLISANIGTSRDRVVTGRFVVELAAVGHLDDTLASQIGRAHV